MFWHLLYPSSCQNHCDVLSFLPPENSHSLHPQVLLTCSGICCTLPLTKATVTSFPSCLLVCSNSGSGVNSNRLLDDKTILDQLPDVGSRVGVGNLVDLIGIKPNLLFSTFHNISRKAFLKLYRAHGD